MIYKIRDWTQAKLSCVCNRAIEIIQRKRLSVEKFSIICSNCIGGVIYKRLGRQFLTPTINCWMNQKEFLRFAQNLDKYLELPLIFNDDPKEYPVARLDDVTIHFNHSRNEDEARNDWERRKKRIDRENLYLIMYDRDEITEDDIRIFGSIPCKNRLVLSTKERPGIDYVMTIKPKARLFGEQCLDKDYFGICTFEKKFDYVKWLNEGSKITL